MQETWSLIFDNVRFGEILFPDMQTVCAELDLGERLLLETVERYGVDAVHGAMRYVCDAAAERIGDGLASMPDGTWAGEAARRLRRRRRLGGVPHPRSRVTKRGGRLEVDFSGTSRQARTCINATALDAKTTVGIAMKYLFDPAGVFTSALLRSVDIVLPEGTIVSALPPDGAVFLYYEQNQAMMAALLRAFAAGARPGGAGRRPRRNGHPHGLRRTSGRDAVGVGRAVRRRDRPLRRQRARRRRLPDALLPRERDRRGGRGGRGRGAGRDAPARDRPRLGRPGLQPRRCIGRARLALAGSLRTTR